MTGKKLIVVGAIALVLFLLLGGNGGEETAQSTVEDTCSSDDPGGLLDGLLKDPGDCVADFMAANGLEGEQRTVWFHYAGSWTQTTDAYEDASADGYNAATTVPGSESFTVTVLDASGSEVYSAELGRDELTTLRVDFLDLAGEDTILIEDSSGETLEAVVA